MVRREFVLGALQVALMGAAAGMGVGRAGAVPWSARPGDVSSFDTVPAVVRGVPRPAEIEPAQYRVRRRYYWPRRRRLAGRRNHYYLSRPRRFRWRWPWQWRWRWPFQW